MVKVREDNPVTQDGAIDLASWLDNLYNKVPLSQKDLVERACIVSKEAEERAIANQNIWAAGSSSFLTGLEMANILASFNLDQDTIIAAILYRAVREGKLNYDEVRREFGENTAKLIDGVQKMVAISRTNYTNDKAVLGQSADQIVNIRKMLVALVDDVRVALIKLAERTCAIRAVKHTSNEKRIKVAKEVHEIYAPLAHRLGIGQIKWELEDLSFRYLEPASYKKIAKLLDEKRLNRQEYIDKVIAKISDELAKENITGEVTGRAKHIFSIYKKMRRKNIGFEQVYDVRAVRILLNEERECYTALGIVHSLWRHIPNEFDDYIANPKTNGYRSLHTAVIGPDGKVLEIQIRTESMHQEAEFGVCAHWLYKQGNKNSDQQESGYEQKINWLRQVLEWHEEAGEYNFLPEEFSSDGNQHRIYVLTPDSHVIDLPAEATPLDFAYRVHTEVGHQCCGAKVNGRIVPLTYSLNTGDVVEILTSKNGKPSRNWLVSDLGYIKSSRARVKIQHWFKQQAKDDNLTEGKNLLEKEFKRLALNNVNFLNIAQSLHFKSTDDMYAAIGAGDLRVGRVLNIAQSFIDPLTKTPYAKEFTLTKPNRFNKDKSGDVKIVGVGNLLTQMANCCKPVPGDEIIGYITVGRGVSIHRSDCSNIMHLQEQEAKRIIEVDWDHNPSRTYPVDIEVSVYNRAGMLRDITAVLANEKVNVLAINTIVDKFQHTAHITLALEIEGLAELGQTLEKINHVSNVIDVRRLKPGND